MITKFPWTISLEQISATEKQDVEIRLETTKNVKTPLFLEATQNWLQQGVLIND